MGKSKSKYAVLGMLSVSDKSGYEISQAITKSTAFFWNESDGQIYPILKRLHNDGLVEITKEKPESKRTKKVYRLTDDGHQELIEWLEQEATTFTVRNELLLKLFFGANLPINKNIVQIQKFQEKLEARLELFKDIELQIKSSVSKHQVYLLLSLNYGQRAIETELQWCKYAINLLREKNT